MTSHIHHLTRKAGRPDVHKTTPYDEDSWQRLIAGSPRSALEKVQEVLRVTTANYLLCIFSFGSLAPQAALRSLELFAEKSCPAQGAGIDATLSRTKAGVARNLG